VPFYNESANPAALPDNKSSPSETSDWHDLTAQQLVRYEALFTLLDDIQGQEDISAIAQQVTKQWKYFANVANWRLLLADENGFLIIDGFRGQATLNRAAETELSLWDQYHWKQYRPTLISVANIDRDLPPPEHLVSKVNYEIQVLPLMRSEKCMGILYVGSRDEPFSEFDNKFIRLLGNYFADRVASLLLQKRALEVLHNKATRDALTEILNRGTIMEQIDTLLSLAKRNTYPLSIIMADIDFFKVINDSYGHQSGDKVLRQVAQRLQATARESDCVGRYGGEEFLIILNHCNTEQVAIAAERFRRAVAETPFSTAGFTPINIPVTISAGTASTDGQMGFNALGLIKQADHALYESKAKGRNRVTAGS